MTVQLPLGASAHPVRPAAAPDLPAHDARDLTGGGNLAQIGLDGQIYTLRITRQGKLILTK
ncbi:hypothetical protein CKO11_07420 [Rhodobacter sp. TJ_12]|uniref:hemin uptake protein HemP n=1 Tax=Rhodobacter sp. TJ_12 TaxID=2029399 RepID=UPI001CBAB993|nr:hemin uptake protein HemP [Rhodobacter sp. TJ_12]MBZ4022285.1 hypothetical protein [Rhodobacter sp. TJ_12]